MNAQASRSTGTGIALGVAAAAISGVSVFVNGFAVKQLPDPAVYTTLKNGVAAGILVAFAVLVTRPIELRRIDRRSWAWLGVIGIVGGSVPFILFCNGLAQASAPSAAFIQKTLFIWVAILAVPLLGERLGWAQLAALGVLLAGQALVLTPANVRWGLGETQIAIATGLWAVETVIAKRVLRAVSAPVTGASRLGIGLVVLVAYLAIVGKLGVVSTLTPTQLVWATATGALLALYVGTWFAALQRAPASLVTAVLVLGAPVTAALQRVAVGGLPSAAGLAGDGLILGAALVLITSALVARRSTVDLASVPVSATP
jgi:drug/metabolite transporter (DMT)-like permease